MAHSRSKAIQMMSAEDLLTSDILRQKHEQEIDSQYERAYAGVEDPLDQDFGGGDAHQGSLPTRRSSVDLQQQMTNESLRKRFGFDEKQAPVASRIIGDTLGAHLIKQYDPSNTSRRHIKYVPFWA